MGREQTQESRDFWTRVAELEQTTGVPRRLAQQVVSGQLTLNDALQKLAQQDRVESLMRKHEMSRALATQVAMGHADLDLVLRKARMRAHKDAHYTSSLLDVAAADGRQVAYALHGNRVVTGAITDINRYEFTVQGKDEPEVIHKLAVKYAFGPKDAKRVRRAMRFEQAVKDAPREPIVRPQDRYTCSDRRLFGYVDSEVMIKVVTLEGERFQGNIQVMSRYEFILKLKGGVMITVFRHALADLSEV